jgi:hypothetical protein
MNSPAENTSNPLKRIIPMNLLQQVWFAQALNSFKGCWTIILCLKYTVSPSLTASKIFIRTSSSASPPRQRRFPPSPLVYPKA